jgi:tRNA pseudouridine38-40 synthase
VRLFDPEEPSGSALDPESPEAAPNGPLRRVMLLVAYDGGPYRGFAPQPGITTVAGALAAALGRLVGGDVSLTCAGRTDAGVHAAGQVVHADLPEDFLATAGRTRVLRSLQRQLGPTVAVLDVKEAPAGFDARHSAVSRRYRYCLYCSSSPNPLVAATSWQVAPDLDLAPMRMAADCLLGEHDFSAFCRRGSRPDVSLVRRVGKLGFARGEDPRMLYFEIEANAFCHQMVRSLVGTIVSVGEGKLTAAGMYETLRSGDRYRGSRLAPARGLCLMAVRYPCALVPGGIWLPPA